MTHWLVGDDDRPIRFFVRWLSSVLVSLAVVVVLLLPAQRDAQVTGCHVSNESKRVDSALLLADSNARFRDAESAQNTQEAANSLSFAFQLIQYRMQKLSTIRDCEKAYPEPIPLVR